MVDVKKFLGTHVGKDFIEAVTYGQAQTFRYPSSPMASRDQIAQHRKFHDRYP